MGRLCGIQDRLPNPRVPWHQQGIWRAGWETAAAAVFQIATCFGCFSEEWWLLIMLILLRCPAVVVVDTEEYEKLPLHLTWKELIQPTKAHRKAHGPMNQLCRQQSCECSWKANWSKAASTAERLKLWLQEKTGRWEGCPSQQYSVDTQWFNDESLDWLDWALIHQGINLFGRNNLWSSCWLFTTLRKTHSLWITATAEPLLVVSCDSAAHR